MADQEQNCQPFVPYELGMVVLEGHVIYNNQIVPLDIFQALGLDRQPQPQQPLPNIVQNNYWNFKIPTFSVKEEENFSF